MVSFLKTFQKELSASGFSYVITERFKLHNI